MALISMARRAERDSLVGIRYWIGAVIAIATVAGASIGAPTNPSKTDAENLVLSAAQAEIVGDVAKSIALLEEAVRTDPKNRLAHWRLGEVQAKKKWLTVEESQQQVAGDRLLAQYHDLRTKSGHSLEDQLALAKWCRKRNLMDESRFHWANVLTADPNNQEAQRALDVRWVRGRLMTAAEVAADKTAEKVRRRERLAANVSKWRYALAGVNQVSEDEVLEGIRSIDYAEAIPVIEDFIEQPEPSRSKDTGGTGQDTPKNQLRQRLSMAFIAALADISDPTSTEALTRLAVWSPFNDVRAEAIEVLKQRPRHDYVPLLLNGLALPVQTPSRVETIADGTVRYLHALCPHCRIPGIQSGPSQIDPPTSLGPINSEAMRIMAEMRAAAEASKAQLEAESRNRMTGLRNRQLVNVLENTTDQKLGNNPKKWWDWWQNENEPYSIPKQSYYQESHHTVEPYAFRAYQPESPIRIYDSSGRIIKHVCFAKGTPIWTKSGRKPIESLREGDLVVSQNVDTGELRYQPVLVCTSVSPSFVLKISFDHEALIVTKGHPFWVAGTGWRMAKELGDGAVLCGLRSASKVQSIEPAGEVETYNLVVGEFNTYFVGDGGILVHDNTPRRPTRAVLPGIVKK